MGGLWIKCSVLFGDNTRYRRSSVEWIQSYAFYSNIQYSSTTREREAFSFRSLSLRTPQSHYSRLLITSSPPLCLKPCLSARGQLVLRVTLTGDERVFGAREDERGAGPSLWARSWGLLAAGRQQAEAHASWQSTCAGHAWHSVLSYLCSHVNTSYTRLFIGHAVSVQLFHSWLPAVHLTWVVVYSVSRWLCDGAKRDASFLPPPRDQKLVLSDIYNAGPWNTMNYIYTLELVYKNQLS